MKQFEPDLVWYQYLDNHKSLLVFMLFITSKHTWNDLWSIQYFVYNSERDIREKRSE